MQTLRRVVAALTFPAIAYLGGACERDTPTTVPPKPVMQSYPPPDLIVDDDHAQCPTATFTTIQAAINAANPNDVILVCAGTYPEPLTGTLAINKTLTLLGAQNTVDARGARGPESIITDMNGARVSASNVVIDGFTVQNSINPNETGYGIHMSPGISGTQILNNIIQDNIAGIGLANSGAQAVIRHNLFQNNNVPGPATGQGIYTDQSVGGPVVENVLVEENAFRSNDVAGIDVSNTDATGGVFNLDVSTNSFDLNGRAVLLFNTHNSSFHDNSVTNSTEALSAAVRILDNNTNFSVLNNNLVNGLGHAIRLSRVPIIEGGLDLPSSGVVINENNIGTVGSMSFVGDGLLVDPGSHTTTVNAECNWWGSNTGPTNVNNLGGTGEEVVGDADFTPWLTAPGGSCIGGLGLHGMVTGGGQINVTGGTGSFGFSAKQGTLSGHLDYMNHFTRAHLNCTVNSVILMGATKARLSGPCSSKNAGGATSFTADVEDNDKTMDKFTITYGPTEGGTIRSGNIQIK